MNDSLYIAATGMHMQQMNVDTIANNLANINTPGFKKARVNFLDLVYRETGQGSYADGNQQIAGMAQGSGVGIFGVSKVFTNGELKKTDLPLDLAIRGDGFFEVTMPDGQQAYTRGGSLIVNKDGFLSTPDGNPLKPGIHVALDTKSIAISPDGTVTTQSNDKTAPIEIGRIELANFADATGLMAMGENLYKPSEKSGDAIYSKPGQDGTGLVAQGFVEASNVQLIDEMVNLMVAQRAYEMSVKVIQASDEMLGMSNNLRR
jgi:flagellar basal-body rod protein FlgG